MALLTSFALPDLMAFASGNWCDCQVWSGVFEICVSEIYLLNTRTPLEQAQGRLQAFVMPDEDTPAM